VGHSASPFKSNVLLCVLHVIRSPYSAPPGSPVAVSDNLVGLKDTSSVLHGHGPSMGLLNGDGASTCALNRADGERLSCSIGCATLPEAGRRGNDAGRCSAGWLRRNGWLAATTAVSGAEEAAVVDAAAADTAGAASLVAAAAVAGRVPGAAWAGGVDWLAEAGALAVVGRGAADDGRANVPAVEENLQWKRAH